MADTFKGIVTADGKKRQLPYGSILNLPSSDPSLTVEGGFADAAVVGKKNKKTDEAIASLKEDMDQFQENGIYKESITLTLSEGIGVVKSNKKVSNVNNYAMSQYIALEKGDIINVVSNGLTTSMACIAVFENDTDTVATDVLGYNTTSLEENVYTATENCYITVTICTLSSANPIVKKIKYAEIIKKIKTDIEAKADKEKISAMKEEISASENDITNTLTFDRNKIVTITGKINSQNGYKTSNIIQLKKGQKISVEANAYSKANVSMLSKWDINGNWISSLHVSTVENDFETFSYTAKEDIEYVRICDYLYADHISVIISEEGLSDIKSDIVDIKNDIENLDIPIGYEYYLNSILCIGDSLTYGKNYRASTLTYPYFLQKLTGIPCNIEARSGKSASDLWVDIFSKVYDFSKYDSYIIWIGTNNGLTDTLETDVIPYSDYNDFAETETGFYCKIISKIIEQVPNAMIFLGTVYASKGNVETTNTTIRKIAKYYERVVGVVENNDFTLFKDEGGNAISMYHDFDATKIHFTRIGNMNLAKHWLNGIRKCIFENQSVCEVDTLPSDFID